MISTLLNIRSIEQGFNPNEIYRWSQWGWTSKHKAWRYYHHRMFEASTSRLFLQETIMTHKIGRDAGTGRFITVDEAQRRPRTTVIETVKTPSKPKAK